MLKEKNNFKIFFVCIKIENQSIKWIVSCIQIFKSSISPHLISFHRFLALCRHLRVDIKTEKNPLNMWEKAQAFNYVLCIKSKIKYIINFFKT